MFGIKDLFTSINVLGGAVAICLCVDGRPLAAGIAVMLGYVFGDALDGWVARKLGTSNDFGAEYDTIADHLAHCIAPGAIVYTVYKNVDLGLPPTATHVVAIGLGSSIMLAASIRHARNVVRPVVFKGVWAGLPRSVLGFLSIAFANSALAPQVVGGYWLGVVLIVLACVMTLTYLPYPSHHLPRGHIFFTKLMITCFFVTTFGMMAWKPEFTFDVLFFWMMGYTLGSWMALNPEERKAFKQAVALAHAGGK